MIEPIHDEDMEEEEVLVYADFDSVLDDRMFQNDTLFKIISLDSEEPFLQIGSQVYSGKWADCVGTHLFFEAEESPLHSDPVFSDNPNSTFNFKFKTRKCLELSRIFINKKEDEQCTTNSDKEVENDSKQNLSNKECEETIEDNIMGCATEEITNHL